MSSNGKNTIQKNKIGAKNNKMVDDQICIVLIGNLCVFHYVPLLSLNR